MLLKKKLITNNVNDLGAKIILYFQVHTFRKLFILFYQVKN